MEELVMSQVGRQQTQQFFGYLGHQIPNQDQLLLGGTMVQEI